MKIAMAEAAETLERFSGNVLYFSDETTLPSPARVKEMLKEMQSLERRVEFSVSSRFDILDRIDDDLLREMRATGCRIMGLGIESGSDRILKTIGKRFTADLVRRGLARLKKVGILPTVSIMVGQYTETEEDVEQSIALMRDSVRQDPNIQYAFTVTTPFPGSRLHSLIFEKGLLRDEKEFYDRYFAGPGEWNYVVNLSDMTDEKLIEMYEKIITAYEEEKKGITPSSVISTEQRIAWWIRKQEMIEKRLAERKATQLMPPRAELAHLWDRLKWWFYEFSLMCLDRFRLRQRGIPAGW